MKRLVLLIGLFISWTSLFSQTPVIKTIGPAPSDYSSLTAAIAALQVYGLTAPTIWELKAEYTSTVETFPINFPLFTGASATNTLTVRPAADALDINIAGSNATTMVRLNGSRYLIFDGRPGGTGTINLTFSNTLTSGSTVLFINDASNNVFRYCSLKGTANSNSNGVVMFGTTTGSTGNDNNLIEYSDLSNGELQPVNLVCSSGSTAYLNSSNSNNAILNCNLYNWFASSNYSSAINLGTGTTAWRINNNSFYQTAVRNIAVTVPTSVLTISSGGGYTIDSNYVGGDSPHAMVVSNPMKYTTAGILQLFSLTTDIFTRTCIDGNVFRNISFTTSYGSTKNALLYLNNGTFDVGTLAGNQFGSTTQTGSITFTMSSNSNSCRLSGIFIDGTSFGDSLSIRNNTIGSIAVSGTGSTDLCGIASIADLSYVTRFLINNNTLGSPTLGASLSVSGNGSLNGIYCFNKGGASSVVEISNNLVSHLYASNSNTSVVMMYGINVADNTNQSNRYLIHNNLVENLTTIAREAVCGMYVSSTRPGTTIASNEIRNLLNSSTSDGTDQYMYGLITYISNGWIYGNFVHNLNIVSCPFTSRLTGLFLGTSGVVTDTANYVYNNMIQLGIDESGGSTATGLNIFGIFDTDGNQDYFFNSVYVGGIMSGSSTSYSAAFCSNNSSTNKKLFNNIFFNGRSGGTACKHYAIYLAGSGANPAWLQSNHNLFFANGTQGTLGYYGSNKTTMADWRAATGQDYNSTFANPGFINPAGSSTAMNLHLQSPTPAEGTGIPIGGITVDYDGQLRSSLTPTDIGADAGTFISTTDLTPPDILFQQLPMGLTSNRPLTSFARITDNTAVSASPNRPRIYYKRSTDANSFVGNLSTNAGWKYAEATNSSSPYSFTIDYTVLYGGSVSSGTTIQYFVVAQDDVNNLASLPAGASYSVVPPVRNVNGAPASPYSYTVTTNTLSGIITMPSMYASFSGDNGLFAALANSVVTGNITVKITGNLSNENNLHSLGGFAEEPIGSNYSMTVVPANGAEKVISLSADYYEGDMLTFTDARNVTFDGRYNGSGRFLHFRSIKTAQISVIETGSASSNIAFRNCLFESVGTNGYGVFLLDGNHHTISGCMIRDRIDDIGVPYTMITCMGEYTQHDNAITDNEILNFSGYGIDISSSDIGGGWNISGNSLYQTMTSNPAAAAAGIRFIPGEGSSGNTISNNWVGGTAAQCGGGYWLYNESSYAASFKGIEIATGSAGSTSIQGNHVANLHVSTSSNVDFIGISLQNGLFNAGDITGNVVGNADIANSILVDGIYGNTSCKGIEMKGTGTIMNSTIANVVFTTATAPSFYALMVKPSSQGDVLVSKNRILNTGPNSACTYPYGTAGIYIGSLFGSRIMVCDNLVSIGHGYSNSDVYYGILRVGLTDCSRVNVYHNSVYLGGTESAYNSYAFANNYPGNTCLRNNIFYNTRTGGSGKHFSIGAINGTGYLDSDYNDLMATGGTLAVYGTTNATDLTAWRSLSGGDLHSLSTNPNYPSTSNLQIASCPALNNKGIYLPEVTTDYAGTYRGDPPDPGAYEFGGSPSVTTEAASLLTSSSATLNGTVSPNSFTLAPSFEYGPSASYGSVVSASPNPVSGSVTTTVTASLSGLSEGTYHYRTKAVSGALILYGSDQTFTITAMKSLNLTLCLEGLYTGAGTMTQASDANGPYFGAGISDKITVELHDGTTYSTLVQSFPDVDLHTNGTVTQQIPVNLNGSYFITVKHRNSITTVSATPVSFAGSVINYNFTDSQNKAFGNNLKPTTDGRFTFYGGDINQDDILDGSDMATVDNLTAAYAFGYLPEDVNGDGIIDGSDMAVIDNNTALYVAAVYP